MSIANWRARLASVGYLADDQVAAAVHLAVSLERPLLVEGPAGVGKTRLAQALAECEGRALVRLQCYEGLDDTKALYDWNYAKQLLASRTAQGGSLATESLYTWDYLLERPLLKALRLVPAPVLLIDEVERADAAFEALLLEFLGEFQITIPELGTVSAAERPRVVLTSNRTRDLSDALRRRCLYCWLDYPDRERELAIIHQAVPELPQRLADALVDAVGQLRRLQLLKPPGVAESLDWARALAGLGRDTLTDDEWEWTLGTVIKTREDREIVLQSGLRALWRK
ncbi:MAG: MoxR family ATPase [Firmicutes bacterium]|nr:MoxR family ATPase [Bacillota bacterium]